MAELESKPLHQKKKKYTHLHDDTDDESSHNGPAVRLRFYGKEKVRMNRTKAITIQTAPGSGHASKCAERMIVDLTLQWPGFPNNNNNNNNNSQQQQQQESEMIMDDVVSQGTFVFPFTIQLPATYAALLHLLSHK